MKPDLRWLDDPRIFRIGQIDAHSDHIWYPDATYAQNDPSPWELSLNGEWEFSYSPDPASRPMDFFLPESDRSRFGHITVPGHIDHPFAFSCLPYTAQELENATQYEELTPVRRTVLCVYGAVRLRRFLLLS